MKKKDNRWIDRWFEELNEFLTSINKDFIPFKKSSKLNHGTICNLILDIKHYTKIHTEYLLSVQRSMYENKINKLKDQLFRLNAELDIEKTKNKAIENRMKSKEFWQEINLKSATENYTEKL